MLCSSSNSISSSATVNNAASKKEGGRQSPSVGGRRISAEQKKKRSKETLVQFTSAQLSSAHHLYGLRLDLINDRTTPEATASLSQGTKERTNERTNAPHRVRTFIDARGGRWRMEEKTKGHRRNSRRALSTARTPHYTRPTTDITLVLSYCTF